MITTQRGHFWLHFDNGYSISIFNDWGSYSNNRDNNELAKSFLEQKNVKVSSVNCEIAILKDDEGFVTREILNCEEDIKGYVDVNELVEIINKVKNL